MTAVARQRRIAAAALDFQVDLERLVAEPAPLVLRLWPLFGALLLGGLVVLAGQTRLDIVVVAQGRLAADVPAITLQPMNRAVLRELLVRPGDLVVSGQLLARLDPTVPEADLATLTVQRRALGAEAARLEADLAGRLVLADSPETRMQASVQAERADLARAQRQAKQAEMSAISAAQASEQSAGPGLEERLAIAREVEAMRLQLAERQTGSYLATLEAKAARLDAEAALHQHLARIDEMVQRLAAARSGLAAFDLDLRRAATEQLSRLRPQLAQLDEQLAKAGRLSALSDLRAPVAGVVLSVATGGPGSIMREGEPVVVLVPTGVPLVAEVSIRSTEVGGIGAGDPVAIKVDAFPWRRNGMVVGRLVAVSRASYATEGAPEARHSGRIALISGLQNLPPGAKLLPGMTITAEIKTGTRTVLDYFSDPLVRGLQESFREP